MSQRSRGGNRAGNKKAPPPAHTPDATTPHTTQNQQAAAVPNQMAQPRHHEPGLSGAVCSEQQPSQVPPHYTRDTARTTRFRTPHSVRLNGCAWVGRPRVNDLGLVVHEPAWAHRWMGVAWLVKTVLLWTTGCRAVVIIMETELLRQA